MAYTPNQVDEIRLIAQPVFSTVLRRLMPGIVICHETSGGKFRCSCPVHRGIDPSVDYMPRDGMLYCHSHCGGMNIFQFVQRSMGLRTFTDAVHAVAQAIGYSPGSPVILPAYQPPPPRQLVQLEEKELETFRHHHPYWHRIPDAIRKHLEGGFCNDNGHILYGRVTFPVRDADGRLVGVTARCASKHAPVDSEQWIKHWIDDAWYCEEGGIRRGMKYRNWGASKVSKNGRPTGTFCKSLILYHYHIAKNYQKIPLVIAEGPFDVAQVLAHGWPAVVGAFGSTLSHEQWDLIRRSHRHVIYGWDSDTFEKGKNGHSKYEDFLYQAKRYGLLVTTMGRLRGDLGSSTREEFEGAVRAGLSSVR